MGNSKTVVKATKALREVVATYPSAKAAGEADGIPAQTVERLCHDRRLPKGEHYYRYADDFDVAEDFSGLTNCPVVAFDLRSRKLAWFPSRAECCRGYPASKSSVSKSLLTGKPVAGVRFALAGKRLRPGPPAS